MTLESNRILDEKSKILNNLVPSSLDQRIKVIEELDIQYLQLAKKLKEILLV